MSIDGKDISVWATIVSAILDVLFTHLSEHEVKQLWDDAAKRRALALYEAEKKAAWPNE